MTPERIKTTDDFIKSKGIIARSVWGAKASKIVDKPENYDWDFTIIAIHHSGRSGDTTPGSIQNKHFAKKYDDVGYHFMIGPQGQIYEGRRLYYKGSHVELANTGKIGILIMGNFEKEFLGLLGGLPTEIQMTTAKNLANSLKILFPTLKGLGGHKDFKKSTECPGNQLYPLLENLRNGTGLAKP